MPPTIDSSEGQSSSKRLHIVGCPRSGTTLMMELMVSCFENDGHCEHEMSIYTPPPKNSKCYFSKKPTDIRYIKKIFLNDPDLYIICLFRDPRSVISSIHKSKQGMYFCNYNEWQECQVAAEKLKLHDRFLLIQYESLTENPNAIQEVIKSKFNFLNKKHDFTEYSEVAHPSEKSMNALSGVRPIDTSRQTGWKQHLPRIKSQYEKHPELADDLIRLGYEKDRAWLHDLESVESKEFPCRNPERNFPLKKWETHIRKFFQSRSYLRRKRNG